jgi:hypothetical protein
MGFIGFETVLLKPEERLASPALVVAGFEEIRVAIERNAVDCLKPARDGALEFAPEERLVGVGELVEDDCRTGGHLRFVCVIGVTDEDVVRVGIEFPLRGVRAALLVMLVAG